MAGAPGYLLTPTRAAPRRHPRARCTRSRRALEHGATGIELDVHATRDGQLVVCHDPTLDRTTNATGEIADARLDELRRLDNAYWFVPGEDTARDVQTRTTSCGGGRRPTATSGWPRSRRSCRRSRASCSTSTSSAPRRTWSPTRRRSPACSASTARRRRDRGLLPRRRLRTRVQPVRAGHRDLGRHRVRRPSSTAASARRRAALRPTSDATWRSRSRHASVPLVVVDEQFVEAAHASGLAVHVVDDR